MKPDKNHPVWNLIEEKEFIKAFEMMIDETPLGDKPLDWSDDLIIFITESMKNQKVIIKKNVEQKELVSIRGTLIMDKEYIALESLIKGEEQIIRALKSQRDKIVSEIKLKETIHQAHVIKYKRYRNV